MLRAPAERERGADAVLRAVPLNRRRADGPITGLLEAASPPRGSVHGGNRRLSGAWELEGHSPPRAWTQRSDLARKPSPERGAGHSRRLGIVPSPFLDHFVPSPCQLHVCGVSSWRWPAGLGVPGEARVWLGGLGSRRAGRPARMRSFWSEGVLQPGLARHHLRGRGGPSAVMQPARGLHSPAVSAGDARVRRSPLAWAPCVALRERFT